MDVTPDDNGKYTIESGYYEGGTIDISAIVEAARQEGKEEGFKEGKEEGLKEGKADMSTIATTARQEGYDAGKKDGDKAGYDRGLAAGKASAICYVHVAGEDGGGERKAANYTFRYGTSGNYSNPDGHGYFLRISWN